MTEREQRWLIWLEALAANTTTREDGPFAESRAEHLLDFVEQDMVQTDSNRGGDS